MKFSRRNLIKSFAALGSVGFSTRVLAQDKPNPNNLPPNLPEWTPDLGAGVDENPYGSPSESLKVMLLDEMSLGLLLRLSHQLILHLCRILKVS